MSADNRVEPILAYSESNYFESENVTYPEGLVEWMDEQKAYVSSVRTGKGEQSPQVKKLWDNPNIIIKQGGMMRIILHRASRANAIPSIMNMVRF